MASSDWPFLFESMNIIILNLKGLSFAFAGAILANALGFPLPWLLGPLLITVIFGIFKVPSQCDLRWRKCGQWVIGTGLGLYFTPLMMTTLLLNWPALVIGIVWALILGSVLAWAQYKLIHLDWATSWFSSCIGGASEMVNIAERYHAQVDKVAAAHSLRIVLLVVCIPVFLEWYYTVNLSLMPTPSYVESTALEVMILLCLSFCAALLANKLKVLNPWVLGPLVVIGGLTAFDFQLTHLPEFLIHFGQLCIGWSLGSKFPFNFFSTSRKFIVGCLVFNMIGLVMSTLIAIVLARLFNFNEATMILGISPGGIAEMALTAKALGLAVPVVVAFQLTRLIVILLTCDYLYNLSKNKMKSFNR